MFGSLFRLFSACVVVGVLFTSPADAEEKETRPVHGVVISDTGDPIAGATIVMQLYEQDWFDPFHLQTTTDRQGHFTLDVPIDKLKPWAMEPRRMVWCYAEGYCLEAASASKQLDSQDDTTPSPLELSMSPAKDMRFTVKDPQGKPLADCRVSPKHWLVGNYDIPPEPIAELVGDDTDAKGTATLESLAPERLRRVEVVSAAYGTQNFSLGSDNTLYDRTLQLADTGTISGKLTGPDGVNLEGVRIAVESYGDRGVGGPTGFAKCKTDTDGGFSLKQLAPGRYYVYLGERDDRTYLPAIPEQIVAEVGKTNTIEIPLKKSIKVVGQVVARGSEQPVIGARVNVSYGHRQSDTVLTDQQGRYQAQVLPGQVRRQLIVVPKAFSQWVRARSENNVIEVSAGDSNVELPPLGLVESRTVEGQLLNRQGKPVADQYVSANLDDGSYGSGKSDDQGAFTMRVAKSAKVTKYRVQSNGPRDAVKVVSEEPLVLQLVDPNTLVNVKITTSPTPAELQAPAWDDSDSSTLPLIVAADVLIFQNRSTDWGELAATLEQLAKQENPPKVQYHLTHASFNNPARSQEAKSWADLLTDTSGIRVTRGGSIILNQAASRYDAIKLGEAWPPAVDKPLVGRIVDAADEPVAGAQVMLLLPPPDTWRYGVQTVYLTEGRVREETDHVVTRTDATGAFELRFPPAGASIMVSAKEGFALAPASTELKNIRLQPWARITGTLPNVDAKHPVTVSYSLNAKLPDGGQRFISTSAGSVSNPSSEFDFVAIPPGDVSIRRTLWRNEDDSWLGNTAGQALSLNLEPGTTTHLEFGPLEDKPF